MAPAKYLIKRERADKNRESSRLFLCTHMQRGKKVCAAGNLQAI